MTGVYLTRHGGPETLELREDIPVPTPGAGEVLVEVLAAGINNTDINTRIGWYSSDVTSATEDVASDADISAGGHAGALQFPRIQGGDLCGRIVATGPETGGWQIGQRVTCPINLPRPTPERPRDYIALGSEIDGAFAQFCLLRADDLYDVTDAPLSEQEIAAIPCAFGTAENLLTRAGVAAGQSVLVTGASGGVGLAAVQLAALRGAHVTALSSPAKAQAVRDAGAHTTLLRDADLPDDTFDVVIDLVAGPSWSGLIDALKPGGQYATSGAIAGPVVEMDLRRVYLRDITIHGATYQPPEVFARLVDLMRSGDLKPLVSAAHPLHQIRTAQAEFETKRLPGKLVLLPPRVAR